MTSPGNGKLRPPTDEGQLVAAEQTLSETDQTSADTDQTRSDSDQTSADTDQLAADQDQAASDRDLAGGVDPRVHQTSREIRRRTARSRDLVAEARLAEADRRDQAAQARDAVAAARDVAAETSDAAMRALDIDGARAGVPRTGIDVILRAAEQRQRASEHRAQAARHRGQAVQDRRAAAEDRRLAAVEREQALADRRALLLDLVLAATDPLTGARMREAGLTDLAHEIDRCRRTGHDLVVAYVDLVGLKARNDRHGHAAGDAALKRIVSVIRTHVRSYDLIVRLGGDEFFCAMSGVPMAEARRRFDRVAEALAAGPDPSEITAGFTALETEDTVPELIARADHDMLRHRPSARE